MGRGGGGPPRDLLNPQSGLGENRREAIKEIINPLF